MNVSGIISRFIHKIKQMKIRTKIMILYSSLLIAALGISMIIYTQMSNTYATNALNELTIRTLETQDKSLELIISDSSDYSKQLISAQNTQDVLDDLIENKLELQRLDREIAASVIFNNKISSAYIYDFIGQQYFRDKHRYKDFTLEDFIIQPWYQSVIDLKGGYYININAGGLIDDPTSEYVSMFRMVNSNYDHQPIGFLMVNIEVKTIVESLNLPDDSGFLIAFEREDSVETLVIGDIELEHYEEYLSKDMADAKYYGDIVVDDINYRVAGMYNQDLGWKLIQMEQTAGRTEMLTNFNFVFILIIGTIGMTIFYGSIFISRYISDPLVKLTKIMEEVEAEKFHDVYLGGREDEIGSLVTGYNYMIHRIQELIDEIINEQETIKKAELRILMEQIKPHFIYNTLDSISALVARGKNEEAGASLTALGRFYRASLSDGNFFVELGTELEIIKNYLYIQNIRYRDLFDVYYDIDESLNHLKVPKLILQPLVENSIYHGIRPIGMDGEIEIITRENNGYVELLVKDNGCGMDREKVHRLFEEAGATDERKKSSVGVPATIRRVRNMYGEGSNVFIDSDKRGTTITIRIPKEKANGETNL